MYRIRLVTTIFCSAERATRKDHNEDETTGFSQTSKVCVYEAAWKICPASAVMWRQHRAAVSVYNLDEITSACGSRYTT